MYNEESIRINNLLVEYNNAEFVQEINEYNEDYDTLP